MGLANHTKAKVFSENKISSTECAREQENEGKRTWKWRLICTWIISSKPWLMFLWWPVLAIIRTFYSLILWAIHHKKKYPNRDWGHVWYLSGRYKCTLIILPSSPVHVLMISCLEYGSFSILMRWEFCNWGDVYVCVAMLYQFAVTFTSILSTFACLWDGGHCACLDLALTDRSGLRSLLLQINRSCSVLLAAFRLCFNVIANDTLKI